VRITSHTLEQPAKAVSLSLAIQCCGALRAAAKEFGNVEFPQGLASFSDLVTSFDPVIEDGDFGRRLEEW